MPDNNWKSYYGDNPDTSEFVNPPFPNTYDDIMKFSDCTNVNVVGKQVAAGRENCIDAVRGTSYTFTKCATDAGAGVATVTLKGSIDAWTFKDCTIGKSKTNTDIELGQFDIYWSPGRKPTRNGAIINCTTTDGSAISVTCWDSESPKVFGSPVKIKRVPWIIWFPYFCLRWFQTKISN